MGDGVLVGGSSVSASWFRRCAVRSATLGLILRFWQLHVTLVLFLLWVAAVCLLTERLGAWNTELLKDTVAWVVVSELRRSSLRPRGEGGPVLSARRGVRLGSHCVDAVPVEPAHLPLRGRTRTCPGRHRPGGARSCGRVGGEDAARPAAVGVDARRCRVLGPCGDRAWPVGIVAWSRSEQTGLAFAFSLWFPLAMLPFVYALSLQMTYGSVFRVMRFRNDGKTPRSP